MPPRGSFSLVCTLHCHIRVNLLRAQPASSLACSETWVCASIDQVVQQHTLLLEPVLTCVFVLSTCRLAMGGEFGEWQLFKALSTVTVPTATNITWKP